MPVFGKVEGGGGGGGGGAGCAGWGWWEVMGGGCRVGAAVNVFL